MAGVGCGLETGAAQPDTEVATTTPMRVRASVTYRNSRNFVKKRRRRPHNCNRGTDSPPTDLARERPEAALPAQPEAKVI